jgi:hypothetical protein
VHDLIGNVEEWTRDLWREDTADRDESWVEDGGATYRAIRGLPLAAEASAKALADGAAYREPLCATGPCVDKTRDRLAYVGFRCVRAGEPGQVAPPIAVAAKGAPRPAPTTSVAPPPCDEASCAASANAGECCDKFRPAAPPPEAAVVAAPTTPAPPDIIDREMIAKGVRTVRARVEACGTGFAGGIVKVSVTVAPDGRVSGVAVKESPDEWLGACVKQRLAVATFAPTHRGFTFAYGFTF